MSAARKLRRQMERDKPRPPKQHPKCPDCGGNLNIANSTFCRCGACGAEWANKGLVISKWEKTKEGNINV